MGFCKKLDSNLDNQTPVYRNSQKIDSVTKYTVATNELGFYQFDKCRKLKFDDVPFNEFSLFDKIRKLPNH